MGSALAAVRAIGEASHERAREGAMEGKRELVASRRQVVMQGDEQRLAGQDHTVRTIEIERAAQRLRGQRKYPFELGTSERQPAVVWASACAVDGDLEGGLR